MRTSSFSAKFKKDINQAKKRGKNIEKLKDVMQLLINDEPLPSFLRDHALRGNWKPRRDIHIEPDWLLIYLLEDNHIHFDRTGSHSDLF
jgi:mRNA interferase YafQ